MALEDLLRGKLHFLVSGNRNLIRFVQFKGKITKCKTNSCFLAGRIFSSLVAETYLEQEFEEKANLSGFMTQADILN